MLRVAAAAVIIAFIFVHSPERPADGMSADASRWFEATRGEIGKAALASDATQAWLRRSLEPEGKAQGMPTTR